MRAVSPGNGFVAIWSSAPFGSPRTPQPDARTPALRLPSTDRYAVSFILHSTHWHGGGPIGALLFAPDPDTPATDAPAIAWSPELDTSILTIVRPVPWARAIGDLRFLFERWGDRVIRIGAPGGTHLLIRRKGSPELQLWLPSGLAPATGGSFGIYLHPDTRHATRIQAASTFRRSIGFGVPVRTPAYAQAHRQATMLYIHDLAQDGAPLRDIAALLMDRPPEDWRSSSERSDLRRLADAATQMIAGGYRLLLGSRPTS